MTETITRLTPDTLPDSDAAGYAQISVVPPGPLAFVSGQVAWRREGGAVPGGLADQADVVFANLAAALEALAAGPADVVQMRAYVTDLRPDRLAVVSEKLAGFLAGATPSLTGVGVAALAAPGLELEVEMVVRLP